MPAYVVFIREQSFDQSELLRYSQLAPAGLAGHSVKPLAMYGTHQILEGPEIEGLAILEFPTFEEAQDWYNSPAYQKALKHRLRGGRYRGVIVKGIQGSQDKLTQNGDT
ncbi:DUF1330 domain-containing protein [Paenibacillus sp. Root444D2]|uniref:DUF1330 domain-containing protein n=1 Tax=Paenibacillus sp. Root444D2 TaxID=1736538 RepID=UPI00070E532C|nr:DUF1330 domain-containing protein [Paenibacillus sp. Root444D2]KQX46851.1 hypothetical protein ASD40_16350 [Paenibacillus sp. Root444D2]